MSSIFKRLKKIEHEQYVSGRELDYIDFIALQDDVDQLKVQLVQLLDCCRHVKQQLTAQNKKNKEYEKCCDQKSKQISSLRQKMDDLRRLLRQQLSCECECKADEISREATKVLLQPGKLYLKKIGKRYKFHFHPQKNYEKYRLPEQPTKTGINIDVPEAPDPPAPWRWRIIPFKIVMTWVVYRSWRASLNWSVRSDISIKLDADHTANITLHGGVTNPNGVIAVYEDYKVYFTAIQYLWVIKDWYEEEEVDWFFTETFDPEMVKQKYQGAGYDGVIDVAPTRTLEFSDWADATTSYKPLLIRIADTLPKLVPKVRFTYYKPGGEVELGDRSGSNESAPAGYYDENDIDSSWGDPKEDNEGHLTNDEYWRKNGVYTLPTTVDLPGETDVYATGQGGGSVGGSYEGHTEYDHGEFYETGKQYYYVEYTHSVNGNNVRFGPYATHEEARRACTEIRESMVEQDGGFVESRLRIYYLIEDSYSKIYVAK